jgi:hypothetical protein
MLDIFLKVAHEHESKQAHSLELAKALSHLPEEELKELARTGEIKLASAENWSAQFKGTELYAKAIELEAESLQKEASAEVRVKQRLLEKLAMDSKVTQALQAVAPSKVKMSLKPGDSKLMANQVKRTMPAPSMLEKDPFAKAASIQWAKVALSNATLGSYAKAQTNPQGLASASKSLMSRGAQLIGSGDAAAGAKKVNQGNLLARKATAMTPAMAKAASVQWAEEAGRIFARNDMAKLADTTSLLKTLKPHAGAIIGGGLGALHGLAKKDGNVGEALMEGTAGAAIGSGAQRLAKHPEVTGLVDKAKARLAKGKPGEQLSLDKIGAAMRASRMQKEAFGAVMAGLAKSIPAAVSKVAPTVGKWMAKDPGNVVKAGLGAVQGIGGVAQARKSGEGWGSALLSGATQAAPTVLS